MDDGNKTLNHQGFIDQIYSLSFKKISCDTADQGRIGFIIVCLILKSWSLFR